MSGHMGLPRSVVGQLHTWESSSVRSSASSCHVDSSANFAPPFQFSYWGSLKGPEIWQQRAVAVQLLLQLICYHFLAFKFLAPWGAPQAGCHGSVGQIQPVGCRLSTANPRVRVRDLLGVVILMQYVLETDCRFYCW